MTNPTTSTDTPATNISQTGATVGGTVTAQGTSAVTDRGIVFNVKGTPNDLVNSPPGNVVHLGSGLGHFSTDLTGLLNPSTDYNVRGWATNASGTGYGANVAFTTASPSGGGGGGGGGGPAFTYPHAGPDSTDLLSSRLFLDDGNLPSRATFLGFDTYLSGDQAQADENAYRAAMTVEGRVGYGWVPSPVGIDGLDAITFANVVKTANIDTLTEYTVTAINMLSSAPEDVSAWLFRGTKIRLAESGVIKYFLVTRVSGSTVTLLGPRTAAIASWQGGSSLWNGQADLAAVDAGSIRYSAPFGGGAGFPKDPIVWTVQYMSPIDSNGRANGDAGGLSFNPGTSAFGTPSSAQSMRVPQGAWDLEWSSYVEVTDPNPPPAALAFSMGIDPTQATEPAGDLLFPSYITAVGGTPPTKRVLASARSARTLSAATTYFLNAAMGLTTNAMHIRNDVRPTVLRAVCRLI